MFMFLPFAVGLLAAGLALAGRRTVAIWAWAALIVVLAAWLKYHASDALNLSL
jgi:hypothetical protein